MRKPHEPTPEQRKLVSALASYGVTQKDICEQVEIDLKTLRKHYRKELNNSMVMANAKVAESLFKMATQKMNVAAAIFWAKTRMGWREVAEIEHSGSFNVTVNVNKKEKPSE